MAIHIKGFEIEAFRGLRNVKFIDCDHVNLIVGNNNSGKTSVLEALFCCHRDFAPSSLLESLLCRGSFFRTSFISGVEWLFPHHQEQCSNIILKIHKKLENQQYSLLQIQEEQIEKYSIQFRDISRMNQNIERDKEENTHQTTLLRGSYNPIENGFRLSVNKNDSIKEIEYWEKSTIVKKNYKNDYPAVIMTPYGHRESSFASFYTQIIMYNLKENFLKLLKCFDEGIEDVQILTLPNEISDVYIQHSEVGLAPLTVFGDGLRRIFCIATVLTQCKNGILLIDEVDAAIHYSAMKDSFDWLVKGAQALNVQLFLTTHSLEAVDALIDATKKIVLYRLEHGSAVCRLAHDQLRRFREEYGMEVR